MGRWKIDYYSTPAGRTPIQEFIENLPEKPRSKIHNTLELLAEFGPILKMPHSKKVTGTPLWELRVLGEASLRLFYIAKVGQSFLLLHGFSKRKQKTPRKEINIALDRLKEYKSRA